MANVVNRADPSIYHVSVDTGNYDPGLWLINPPSFSILRRTVEPYYWKIVGEDIAEMSQAEKDVVDAAIAADINVKQQTEAKDFHQSSNSESRALRSTVRALVDELNAIRQWTAALKREIAQSSSLSDLQSRVNTLDTLSDRTYDQAKVVIYNNIDSGG